MFLVLVIIEVLVIVTQAAMASTGLPYLHLAVVGTINEALSDTFHRKAPPRRFREKLNEILHTRVLDSRFGKTKMFALVVQISPVA